MWLCTRRSSGYPLSLLSVTVKKVKDKNELLTEFRSRLVCTHSLASLYSSISPIIYSVSSESMMDAPLRPPAKQMRSEFCIHSGRNRKWTGTAQQSNFSINYFFIVITCSAFISQHTGRFCVEKMCSDFEDALQAISHKLQVPSESYWSLLSRLLVLLARLQCNCKLVFIQKNKALKFSI